MFGMGTGGTLQLLSPETFLFGCQIRSLSLSSLNPHLQNRTGLTLSQSVKFFSFSQRWHFFDQALDLLVSASSICYHTSTADLSTSSSLRGLTYLRSGSLILQGGFTLRCLQRLSRPHFASQLCPWQNNCFTRGASIPVLSY